MSEGAFPRLVRSRLRALNVASASELREGDVGNGVACVSTISGTTSAMAALHHELSGMPQPCRKLAATRSPSWISGDFVWILVGSRCLRVCILYLASIRATIVTLLGVFCKP